MCRGRGVPGSRTRSKGNYDSNALKKRPPGFFATTRDANF
jgi:hypothetical protein